MSTPIRPRRVACNRRSHRAGQAPCALRDPGGTAGKHLVTQPRPREGSRYVIGALDRTVRQFSNPAAHVRRSHSGGTRKSVPVPGTQLLQRPASANPHCKPRIQPRIRHGRQQVVQRCERDRSAAIQQTVVLAVSIRVADQCMYDERVEKLENLDRPAGCKPAAQARNSSRPLGRHPPRTCGAAAVRVPGRSPPGAAASQHPPNCAVGRSVRPASRAGRRPSAGSTAATERPSRAASRIANASFSTMAGKTIAGRFDDVGGRLSRHGSRYPILHQDDRHLRLCPGEGQSHSAALAGQERPSRKRFQQIDQPIVGQGLVLTPWFGPRWRICFGPQGEAHRPHRRRGAPATRIRYPAKRPDSARPRPAVHPRAEGLRSTVGTTGAPNGSRRFGSETESAGMRSFASHSGEYANSIWPSGSRPSDPTTAPSHHTVRARVMPPPVSP